MPMRRAALLLTVVLAASATPALADFLKVELTVAFFPPSTFSMDSHLAGSANFYIDIPGGNGPQPTDSPAPILFLDAWDRNVTVVEDSSLVNHRTTCGFRISEHG